MAPKNHIPALPPPLNAPHDNHSTMLYLGLKLPKDILSQIIATLNRMFSNKILVQTMAYILFDSVDSEYL